MQVTGRDRKAHGSERWRDLCKTDQDRKVSEMAREDKKFKIESCDDCISRKAAIQGLGEQPYVWTDSDSEIQELQDWKNAKKMLEELPPVFPITGKSFEELVAAYCEEHGQVIVDKDVWEDLTKVENSKK